MRDAFELRVRLPSTILVVGIATALMITIGFGLIRLAPVNPSTPDSHTMSQFIPSYVGALHPKPGDRFMFMSMIIALAAVIACAALTVRKLAVVADEARTIFGFALFAVGVVTVVEGSFFGLPAQFDGQVVLCFLASLSWVVLSLSFNDLMQKINLIIAIVLNTVILITFRYLSFSNISDLAQFTSHYEAVIYSVVKIEQHGVLLMFYRSTAATVSFLHHYSRLSAIRPRI